jgi:ketosteroid isomerase-like protein
MVDPTPVIEELIARWNAHDREGCTALFDEGVVLEAPGGLSLSGRSGWESFYDLWTGAFPDNAVAGPTVRGGGDLAVQEARFTGTHTGTLHAPSGDVPATGRRVDLRYTAVQTVREGRVTSFHLYFDQVDLLTQLGLMPAPAATT